MDLADKKEKVRRSINKKEKIELSEKRSKILKEGLRKAIQLMGRNPILMEPKYMALVVSIYAGDDPVLATEFNKFLKESGTFNQFDEDVLDDFFWNWLKKNHAEEFNKNKGEGPGMSGEVSLHRISEALKEELEEKFEREGKLKIQHAKDKIREELSKEFAIKIKEVLQNTGQTSESLSLMDAIIEKGGKKALDLISEQLETAKGSTDRIMSSADDLQSKVKKLEEEIQYDTIPGLYTVRVFSKKFQEMAIRFKEEEIPFSVGFISVDKLADYVQSSDPMVSRKIFLGVAMQIIDELNSHPSNIVPARYDVNLMGILLPYNQLDKAADFSRQICFMIEEHKFFTKDGKHLDLTVSAGIAEYADYDSFWFDDILGGGKQLSSTVFNRAIEALKNAQSGGGNRVGIEKKTNDL